MSFLVLTIGVFPKWSRTCIKFSEFRESDKITEVWIGLNLKVLFLTCVLLALWYFPGLWHRMWQVWAPFNDAYFCHWIRWIEWKLLGKTPLWLINFMLALSTRVIWNLLQWRHRWCASCWKNWDTHHDSTESMEKCNTYMVLLLNWSNCRISHKNLISNYRREK